MIFSKTLPAFALVAMMSLSPIALADDNSCYGCVHTTTMGSAAFAGRDGSNYANAAGDKTRANASGGGNTWAMTTIPGGPGSTAAGASQWEKSGASARSQGSGYSSAGTETGGYSAVSAAVTMPRMSGGRGNYGGKGH